MHVVNNLSAFLMFEVMESAWQTLLEAVHRACCLDDVIRAHDAYLGEIMDRALLAPQHESINMQVQCRAVPCRAMFVTRRRSSI
jgi:Gamma tubulin complex component C-terminal